MFDIGWSELAVIFVVALVVLGPKELPGAMRTFTHFMKTLRGYANEFRKGMDQIVKDADLQDAKKAMTAVRSTNPSKAIEKLVDPTGEITKEIKGVEAAAKKAGQEEKPVPPALPQGEGVVARESASSEAPVKQEPRIIQAPLSIAPAHSIRPPQPIAAEPEKVPSEPEKPV